jgi:Trypsin-co-occurring domain 1
MVGLVAGTVEDRENSTAMPRFEVAVAFASPDALQTTGPGTAGEAGAAGDPDDGIPGVDDAAWSLRRQPRPPGSPPVLVQMGQDIVRDATDALAAQIGATARRIADSIGQQDQEPAKPGTFALDSVEVAFGVTLTGGVQTLFTLQAESSVQVTITLSRRH